MILNCLVVTREWYLINKHSQPCLCVLYFQWDQFLMTEAFKRSSQFFNKQMFLFPCPLPMHVRELKILKSCTKKYNVFIHLPMEKWQHRISKTEASEYLIEWCLEVCLMQETCIIGSDVTTKVDIWNCAQKKTTRNHTQAGGQH